MTGVALDAQAVKASRFSGYAAGGSVDALVLGSSRSMMIVWAIVGLVAVNILPETWDVHFGVSRRWALAYAVGLSSPISS
jgi:hypothetical protein